MRRTALGPALVKCLNDTSWEVRRRRRQAPWVCWANLRRWKVCAAWCNDPDHDVRASAIAALGQIGDRRAIVPLVPALMDEESPVRNAAAAALHKLDRNWAQQEEVRQVEPKIINALKHPDYWVRHSAGKLLELLKVDPNHLSPAPPPPRRK